MNAVVFDSKCPECDLVERNIIVTLPQDREFQIKLAVSFYGFMKLPKPSICGVCGGIQDNEQSKTRRCMCGEAFIYPPTVTTLKGAL